MIGADALDMTGFESFEASDIGAWMVGIDLVEELNMFDCRRIHAKKQFDGLRHGE